MRYDFNKLRTFIAVADELSVTKAAGRLHLTQQAVSHQIQSLESELGFTLFRRANRRIYLTKEGDRVLELSRHYLLELENKLAGLSNDATRIEGRLNIGCVHEIGQQMVAPIIAAYNRIYPNVAFELTLDVDHIIERKIIENSVDIGFLVFSSEHDLLETKNISNEEFSAVASPDFIKKHGKIDSFEKAINLPVVDFTSKVPSFSTWVKKNSKASHKKLIGKRASISAPDDLCLKNLALAGAGIAVIPLYLAKDELASGGLVEVLPAAKRISAMIDIAYMKGRDQSSLMSSFIDFVLSSRSLTG